MALIEDTKKERKDGGYTRIFNNSELGGLLSKVHATTIRCGNELEKIVIDKHNEVMTLEEFDLFVQGKLNYGKQRLIMSKLVISKKLKKYIKSKNEPDFVIIIIEDNNCYIIELKDGDTFDTKKSKGELASLKEFAECFRQTFGQYNVFIKICSFNCETNAEIVTGLKNFVKLEETMTGKEFCKLIGISYENIIQQRKEQAKSNIKYFAERLKNIDEIKELLK